MPSEPIKRAYRVGLAVETVGPTPDGRWDLSIAWGITDGGEPFCDGVLNYACLPTEAADWIQARIGRLTAGRKTYEAEGLTYRQVVKFETGLIKMLVDLNARGVALAFVRSSEKPAAVARLFRTTKTTRPRRARR